MPKPENGRTHNQYRLDNESKKALDRAIGRIEKIDGEIADLQDDKKQEMAHLKSAGYDTAAVREFIAERKKRRRMGADKFDEREDMKDLYRSVIGLGDD